jgi:CRP/FNR family transcriptional regulator, cyclic AMP receptor protein
LLEEFPAATMRAAEHLSRDCNEAYDHIRTIGLSGSVLERVARMIYDYTAEAQPSKDGDTKAKLALTHEEIAQLLGTSRETVSRALSDLKRRGLAEIRGATLVVHDRPQLAKAARAH